MTNEQELKLDDLEHAVGVVAGLLKDRHPGLTMWNEMLHRRLVSLRNLIDDLVDRDDDTAEREAFERAYAERSGLSVAELRRRGLQVVFCGCGEDGCCGWRMVTAEYKSLGERTCQSES